MKSFVEEAQFYTAQYQHTETRYAHAASTLFLTLSFMILLGFIKIIMPGVFSLSFAALATLALLAYYFRLNWQVASFLTPIFLILLWISTFFNQGGPSKLGLWAFIITFTLGFALHLYAHYYIERKNTALFPGICQILLSPLVVTAELIFLAGYLQTLKAQVYDLKAPKLRA